MIKDLLFLSGIIISSAAVGLYTLYVFITSLFFVIDSTFVFDHTTELIGKLSEKTLFGKLIYGIVLLYTFILECLIFIIGYIFLVISTLFHVVCDKKCGIEYCKDKLLWFM